jgi:hypothetical protein
MAFVSSVILFYFIYFHSFIIFSLFIYLIYFLQIFCVSSATNIVDIGPYFISTMFGEWGGSSSNVSKLDISNNQLTYTGMRF